MGKEVTLEVDYRQALQVKHGLERAVLIRNKRLNHLLYKSEPEEKDISEIKKILSDIHDEEKTIKDVERAIKKFIEER